MSAKEEVQRVNDQVIAAAAKGDFAPFVNVLADDVEVFDHVAYLFEGKGPFLEYLQSVTAGAEATTSSQTACHSTACSSPTRRALCAARARHGQGAPPLSISHRARSVMPGRRPVPRSLLYPQLPSRWRWRVIWSKCVSADEIRGCA